MHDRMLPFHRYLVKANCGGYRVPLLRCTIDEIISSIPSEEF